MTKEQALEEIKNAAKERRGAALRGADLAGVDLREADLAWANLAWADLAGADLAGADLAWADLREANLAGADLAGADLTWSDLTLTDLRETGLRGTILDPNALPNCGKREGWECDIDQGGTRLFGYRTQGSPVMGGDGYEVGKTYEAPVFSTCPVTPCHPGLFVCQTVKEAREHGERIIRVAFDRFDLHLGGNKHRVRKFEVLEVVARGGE